MMMMMTRTKITKNLLIQYNSLHKEITLQNALRYNFAACIALCLSPCRFSESEKKNGKFGVGCGDGFSKKIFRQELYFLTG